MCELVQEAYFRIQACLLTIWEYKGVWSCIVSTKPMLLLYYSGDNWRTRCLLGLFGLSLVTISIFTRGQSSPSGILSSPVAVCRVSVCQWFNLLGPDVQNTLIKIPIVLGDRLILTSKVKFNLNVKKSLCNPLHIYRSRQPRVFSAFNVAIFFSHLPRCCNR